MDRLQEVIKHNRAVQEKARELNRRAGENIFIVLSLDEWNKWLETRLNGAVSVATIVDFDNLKLPALDEEMIALVMHDNPNTLEVLRRTCKVEYQERQSPSLTFSGDDIDKPPYAWQELPDEGVKLPGGRIVRVVLKTPNSYYEITSDTDIPKLKEKMRQRLNSEQWNSWQKPVIRVSDMTTEDAKIPEIETQEYGKCVVTGETLFAYGAITAYRSWSSDPVSWRYEWFRSREEAEEKFQSAKTELEKAKAEAREKREYQAAKEAAERTREKAKELFDQYGSYNSKVKISSELKDELGKLIYPSWPSKAEDLRLWKAEADRVISATMAVVNDAMEAEERKMRRQIATRDILQKEYAKCPICGQTAKEDIDWQRAEESVHEANSGALICDCIQYAYNDRRYEKAESTLRAIETAGESYAGEKATCSRHSDAVVITRTYCGAETLADLLVFHKWGQWNCHLQVYPERFREGAEIRTKKIFSEPSKGEAKILAEMAGIKSKLTRIEDEKRDSRIEITFKEGKDPKGNPQLQGEGIYTGGVRNKFAENGWAEYENRPVIFVTRVPCSWLDKQPKAGENWLCTVGMQIAMSAGKPIIVVNPQMRNCEQEWRQKLAELEAALQIEKEKNPQGEAEEINIKENCSLEDLKKKFARA